MWVDSIVWFSLAALTLCLCAKSRLGLQGGCEQTSKEGEGNFIHIRVMKLGASNLLRH